MAIPKSAGGRVLFTDSWLRGLKPGEKRVEYADTKERALRLRVGAKGKTTFDAYCRIKRGDRIRKQLGEYPAMSLFDARRAAEDVRKLAQKGKDARVVEKETEDARKEAQRLRESRENFDLAGMTRWYVKDREENPEKKLATKSAHNYHALIRYYLEGPHGEPFRGRFAGEVPAFEIRELLKAVALKSSVQANRLFELIRAAYRLASYEGRVESVPALKRPAKSTSRERVLTQREITAFWKATETATLIPRQRKAPKDAEKARRAQDKAEADRRPISLQARAALRMLLTLGQRKGETLAMRWADIDGAVWRIPGATRKGGKAHTVPLSTLALEILEELRPITGAEGRVFAGISATNMHGRAFRAVREAVTRELKTTPFSIHDLRRTFTTQARELCNLRPDVVGDVLGHISGKHASAATASYDKSTGTASKESALEAWGETLRRIVGGEVIGDKGKILAFR